MDTNIGADQYNIPDEYVDEMKNAMGEEGIRLPFTVTYWRWINSQTVYKPFGNAPYFGGWAANIEDVETAMQEYGALPLYDEKTRKGSFRTCTLTKRDGGEYDVYVARALAVAVIGKRSRWIVDARKPNSKGTSHTQILGFAGYRDGDEIKPWGPVVLTAKGYASGFMRDAFRNFERKTQRARQQFAHGIPAWFFYAIVGTFGEKPATLMVGEVGAQSPVTPCELFLPEQIDAQALQTWYMGEGVIEQVMDLRHEAQEWLEDKRWKSGRQDGSEEEGLMGGEPPQPESWQGDEIPF